MFRKKRNKNDYVIISFSQPLSKESLWNSGLVPLFLSQITSVLYFEQPQVALLSFVKNPFKWIHNYISEKKIVNHRIKGENIKVIKLFSLFPLYWSNEWSRKLNNFFLLLQIRWFIRHYPFKKRIILAYFSNLPSIEIIKSIPAYRLVYHCVNDISAVPWPNKQTKVQNIRNEITLAKLADLIITISPYLTKKMKKYNHNVKMLMNDVVDFEHFNKAIKISPPKELKNFKRPIVGYVGGITKLTIDFDLLNKVALKLPNWSFVIIGPKYDEHPSRKNIIYLGPRYYEEIPKYIAAFDVCIIPHNNNSYIRHSFTMKLFQYLALGKPVVATDKPLQVYKDYIYLVKNDPDDFVAALQKALQEKPERKQSRIKLAKDHNWNIRAHEIFNLLIGTKACK